jgi:hypothetical protein
MNAKLFQRLTIGEGVGTRHISFKRYTALGEKGGCPGQEELSLKGRGITC